MQPAKVAEAIPTSVLDPNRIRRAMEPFELLPVQPEEIPAARTWAAALIGPAIAPAAAMLRVHRLMGEAAVFVRRDEDELVGVLGWIALSERGHDALFEGRFHAQAPAPEHVARPGQAPSACYGWGIAGGSRPGARAVVCATQALYLDLFPTAPWFTRAATEDGRRVILGRFGYEPAPGRDGDLLWRPPARGARP